MGICQVIKFPSFGASFKQILAHADFLGALPGKQETNFLCHNALETEGKTVSFLENKED
jgi:hypothetical protein